MVSGNNIKMIAFKTQNQLNIQFKEK